MRQVLELPGEGKSLICGELEIDPESTLTEILREIRRLKEQAQAKAKRKRRRSLLEIVTEKEEEKEEEQDDQVEKA